MTKVATFMTKQNHVLSKQIKESMARISPGREISKPTACSGAAGLLTSHNLGTKMGLLTKSVSSTKLSMQPFRARENTLTAGPSSPFNQTTNVTKAFFVTSQKRAENEEDEDENKTPLLCFDSQDNFDGKAMDEYRKQQQLNGFSKTSKMTIDELEVAKP